jgi:hypothetical protein
MVKEYKSVDAAAIDQRISALPGEVSVPRVGIREVSRGHSSEENEPSPEG